MEYIKNLFEQTNKYYLVTPKEIISNLDTFQITTIKLKQEEISRLKDKVFKDVYTTEKNPFLIGKTPLGQGNTLYINPDYYLKNSEKVEKLLSEIIKQTKEKKLDIASCSIITKNVINLLSKSKTIEEVSLAENDDEKYSLTQEDYNKLKNSSIKKVRTSALENDLKDNFDSLISYNYDRALISYYTYKDLFQDEIKLFRKITEQELENLKYLPNNQTKIIVKEENIEDAIIIAKKLDELGKENHIIIEINNKELVNPKILSNDNYLNPKINIQLENNTLPIKEYLRFEKILYQMVESAKDLSPFEKYIYAYNVVKQYKQYKENEQDTSAARNLYAILENEYMVCVGYSHLLEDLLNKSGIKSIDRSVAIDISYDKENENEVISSKKGEHARRYIYINDPKYGIDGFYVTDPTWDNNLDKDLYNHLLLTGKEETNTRRYNFISPSIYSSFTELMNIKSLEELYQKINFYLDRNPQRTLNDILKYFTKNLKKLVPDFIQSLEEKYPEMLKDYINWPNEKEILYEIGEYLLNKVNKPVSGQTIMSAVSEVYQKAYHLEGEELQNKLKETIEINNQRQHLQFPKREKIDEYGNQVELPGISNKFNIDTNTYHK